MVFQNNLREISKIIYRLKRNFGLSMSVWHPDTTSHNLTTGAIVRTYSTQYLRRGVMLPTRALRDFVYDLSYIAAGKNFTYGAYFDADRRFILIDSKDLTDGFEFTAQDYVAFQNRFYNVVEIAEAENRKAWMLIVKEVSSTDVPSPYTVTGTLVPDATGAYFTNGVYNSQPTYQNERGTWWIWYEAGSWYITQIKGIISTATWERVSTNIVGNYAPILVVSGTATVVAN